MSQLISDLRAGGGLITSVEGGNNITVNTVGGVATVNVSGTTNHAVQIGNALGALTSLPLGDAGQVLTSNGPGLDPSFQDISAVTVAYGQVYNQGAQTIPNGTNVTFDSNGPLLSVAHLIGSDTITVNDTGLFMIQWTLQTDEFVTSVSLNVNGVSVPNISYVSNPSTESEYNGEGIVLLNSGDLVTLTVFSGASTDLLVLAGFTNASMTLQKLNVATGTADSAALFNTDAGLATVAGATINIVGGAGISTSGAGNTVTISAAGGASVTQINGDTGSATGSTINIISDRASNNAGGTVFFDASGSTVLLEVTDSGLSSTFVGGNAGNSTSSGIFNSAFGASALTSISSGVDNTAIGTSALSIVSTASFNTAVGVNALSQVNADSNTAIGFGAGGSLNTGSTNVAIGVQALLNCTSGIGNIAIGNNSIGSLLTGSSNIAIGGGTVYNGGESSNIILANAGTVGDNNVTRIGAVQTRAFIAGIFGVTPPGTINTVIIDNNGQLGSTASAGGVTINGDTGSATGSPITFTGLSTAGSTVAFNASGSSVTFRVSENPGGNLYMGESAGTNSTNAVSGATQNVALGFFAAQNVSGQGNTHIGFQAGGASLAGGSNNVAVGNTSMGAAINASFNVAVGTNTLVSCTGAQNVALGFQALRDGGAINNNIGIGFNSGLLLTTDNNIAIGAQALQNASTGGPNIAIGQLSMANSSGSTNNIAIGISSGSVLQGANNVLIGSSAGISLLAADRNTLVGTNSGFTMTTGQFNAALGFNSLLNSTSDTRTVAIGDTALGSLQGTSDQNTAVGYGAGNGSGFTTGSFNTFLGSSTGTVYAGGESSNILIGSQVTGVAAESNVLRIGAGSGSGSGQISAAFIHGIFGATVGVSGIPVVIDNASQLGTVVSSARFKYDIQDLAATDVLKLRPVSFKYKKTNEDAIGLIAEEVEKVMPSLVAYDKSNEAIAVKYNDLPVLLLAEIQKLQMRVKQLEEKLACH